ncbi:MAG: hypothetical protein ACI841_002270 [Planctomycetota bacterium]|jgi:hypothetical protein
MYVRLPRLFESFVIEEGGDFSEGELARQNPDIGVYGDAQLMPQHRIDSQR